MIKLGLIGQHIQKTSVHRLHEYLGKQHDLPLAYDLFDVRLDGERGLDEMLDNLSRDGYRGVNVTHPYKVLAWSLVPRREAADPGLGALNTVILNGRERRGTNTDCIGFGRVMGEHLRGDRAGRVFIMGAGGVGRAIAFGLGKAGAEQIYLYDESPSSLESLAAALRKGGGRSVGRGKGRCGGLPRPVRRTG